MPTGKGTGKEVGTDENQVGPCPQVSKRSPVTATLGYVPFSGFHIHSHGLRQPSVPLTSTEPTLEVATESWNPLKEKEGQAQGGPASPEVLITKSESMLGSSHPSIDVLPRSFALDTES